MIINEKAQSREREKAEKEKLLSGVKWNTQKHIVKDEGGTTAEYTHSLTINKQTFTFKERNLFDVGRVINASPEGTVIYDSEKSAYFVEKFKADEGWVKVRDLSLNEARAYTIVDKYGVYSNSPIRMEYKDKGIER